MRLRELRVATKLRAVLALAIVVTSVMLYTALSGLADLAEDAADIVSEAEEPAKRMIDFAQRFAESRILIRDHGPALDRATMTEIETAIAENDAAVSELLVSMAATSESTHVQAVSEGIDEWLAFRDAEVIPASHTNDFDAVRTKNLARHELGTAVRDSINAYGESQSARADEVIADTEETGTTARQVLLVVSALGTALLVAAILWITRTIVRPLGRISHAAERLAAGDLVTRSDVDSADDFGTLGEQLDTALDSLRGTVGAVAERALQLSAAATELSAVSTRLSDGGGETSSSAALVSQASESVSDDLTTDAQATEEMNNSISEIARNASDATRVARKRCASQSPLRRASGAWRRRRRASPAWRPRSRRSPSRRSCSRSTQRSRRHARRGRQGFRRRDQRGEAARRPDGTCDDRDRITVGRGPGLGRRGRGGDPAGALDHRERLRPAGVDRLCRRGTDRDQPGDQPHGARGNREHRRDQRAGRSGGNPGRGHVRGAAASRDSATELSTLSERLADLVRHFET